MDDAQRAALRAELDKTASPADRSAITDALYVELIEYVERLPGDHAEELAELRELRAAAVVHGVATDAGLADELQGLADMVARTERWARRAAEAEAGDE